MNVQTIVKRFYTHAAIMLIFRWYFWDLAGMTIQPFVILFGVPAAAISCLCFLVYALVYATGHYKTLNRRALTPLLIISITIGMALFFPFTRIAREMDFTMNLKARNTVVTLIESEKLQPEPESPYLIQLPWYCRHLSKGGGEVSIIKYDGQEFYLFYTFRGIINEYTGFIHVPKEPAPSAMYSYYDRVEKMRDGWYYCVSG